MLYRNHRCPCDLPVKITLRDGQTCTGVIINISPWGVRLARVPPMTPGEHIFITLPSIVAPAEAEVRWSGGPYVGVRFAKQVDTRTIALVRKSVSHRPNAKHSDWNSKLRELR
jgi:hypothetical protein